MFYRDKAPAPPGPSGPSIASDRVLVGRERELKILRDFLDETATRGATLVVSVEPGVEKSAPLEGAVARAHDLGTRSRNQTSAEYHSVAVRYP